MRAPAEAMGSLGRGRAVPTMDEWLEELEGLTPAADDASGAEAVQHAREVDDAELTGVHDRR